MPMRNSNPEWVFPEIFPVPANFQAKTGSSTVVTQTLFRRGITTLDDAIGFLDPDYYHPSPPSELPGLEKSVDRIQDALKNNQNILVWGDFDVDGQTSTTLLVSALAGLGSKIFHYIPNRARESHGVSPDTLVQKIAEINPSLLITCDTGIDALESATIAQSAGVDLIITDHHQLPQVLPSAYAIVNPNLLEEKHALYSLPGVGVAYKLIESLYARLNRDPEPLLDLVALGIVADVAVQTRDTRYLLQIGLRQLRKSSRLGIQQLCKIGNINQTDISEEEIGFVIGPRLNALGRLDDANSCVDFFTTTDPSRAAELAAQLDHLNIQRQHLTEEIYQDSLRILEQYPEYARDYPIIVLNGPGQWHPGVIGIVASRIVERFQKPVIMLSKEGRLARGSARSIPGVPISALISESSSLLISFGGHPMAAGVSLPFENIAQFRRGLAKDYDRIVGGPPELPRVLIDAEIPFKTISTSFVKDFQRLAPFGAGNPKLLFATRGVHLIPGGIKIIGKNSNHKKITLADSSGSTQDFLWWNSAEIDPPSGIFDAAYSLDLSTYKNKIQLQATFQSFREFTGTPVIINGQTKIELIDLRSSSSPEDKLSDLLPSTDTIIWSELNSPAGFSSVSRLKLIKSTTLVIWTTPPSLEIFKYALHKVKPKTIVFFAQDPDVQSVHKFITNLLRLLKNHINKEEKSYDSASFAQAIAVTPALIEVGLDWIHLHGDFDLSLFYSEGRIKTGPKENLDGFQDIDKKLKFMIKEMAAYRNYFNKAKLDTLL